MEAPVTGGKRTMMSPNKIRWRRTTRRRRRKMVSVRAWKMRKCIIERGVATGREKASSFAFEATTCEQQQTIM